MAIETFVYTPLLQHSLYDSRMTHEPSTSLEAKIDKWLASEGYPLEYFTAGVFRSHKFDVHQGSYTRPRGEEKPRELDLVADKNIHVGDRLIRISTVVECKWSKDKPWVVFTSPRARMATSACIAQTIGNTLADSLLWMVAGEKRLHDLGIFHTPELPAFGGRQALTKGNDLFYTTMSAVTSGCVSLADDADRGSKLGKSLPRYALICLPVVVLDGRLFEASYNQGEERMHIAEVQHIRCHWRGSAAWPLHASVDIVTREGLPVFVKRRADDHDVLLPTLEAALKNLETAYKRTDWEALGLQKGSTGRGSMPVLLAKIRKG